MRLFVPDLEETNVDDLKESATVAGVEATLAKLRTWLAQAQLVTMFEIEDYPIGRNARGRCRLAVEFSKTKRAYRTVKQTTDKRGQWCKPHCSTYHEGFLSVVKHPDIEAAGKEAGWLLFAISGVHVMYANGKDSLELATAPHYTRPRRTEDRYTITTRSY